MRILSRTVAIRDEIRRLMARGTRRVVLTAFVGAGADAYLPHPKGITIVCWPKAGGTNPNAIRDLRGKGVIIRFADGLHMKLYWAQGRGALIGSANLTTNALGAGGLKEIAVTVPAESVDIAGLLAGVKSRPYSHKELRRLEREHNALGRQIVGRAPTPSLTEWLKLPDRAEWKLGWWDRRTGFSKEAKSAAKEIDRRPRASVVGRRNDFREGDWILSFKLTDSAASLCESIYVNAVVRYLPSREPYPYEALQAWSNRERTAPPFRIDRAFRKAFNAACAKFGYTKLEHWSSTRVPPRLVKLIQAEMRKA